MPESRIVCRRIPRRDAIGIGWPMGPPTERPAREPPAGVRESPAGTGRDVELSGATRPTAPTAAVIVVMIAAMAVTARIASVIMFMSAVLCRLDRRLCHCVRITVIVVLRRAGCPTRLISARPTPQDPLRPRTAGPCVLGAPPHLPQRQTANAAPPADPESAAPLQDRNRNFPPSPLLVHASC